MTADQLLVNIKDRAAIPPSQVSITDVKLLQAATEEMQAYIVPLIDSSNEGFFTDSVDKTILANVSVYDVPTRAAGGALNVLKFVDSAGNESGGPIPRVELTDIGRYSSLTSSFPLGFYWVASSIVLLPAIGASPSGSLRMYYSSRPGALVSDTITASQHTAVGIVTSLTSTVITLNANTNGWAANTTIDIVGANSPFKLLAKDIATTTNAAGSATITVGTDLTALGIVAGDYVTLANTSYVPRIPQEWHSILELRAVSRAFSMLGDTRSAGAAGQYAKEMEQKMMGMTQPRSSGNSRKVNAWRR